MRGGGKRGDQKNVVCVLSKKEEEEEEEKINSKKKNFRSTLFTSTHTQLTFKILLFPLPHSYTRTRTTEY